MIGWSNAKFSELSPYELYGEQYGKLVMRSLKWKGYLLFELKGQSDHAAIVSCRPWLYS